MHYGIDVSQSKLDVTIYETGEYFKVGFHQPGLFSLLKRLDENARVLFEATGIYSIKLSKFFTEHSVKHKVANARQVKDYIKSLHNYNKTDKADSAALAKYASTLNDDEFNSEYDEKKEKFRSFTSAIEILDKQIVQLKNHIKNLPDTPIFQKTKTQLEMSLDYLQRRKESLEKEAREEMKQDYSEQYSKLSKVKSVGDKTLLYLLPHIESSKSKYTLAQIYSFFGLNPISRRSGTSINYRDRLNMFGHKKIKSLLYFVSITASRFNKILKAYYERQKSRNKATKIILLNIAKKIVRLVYLSCTNSNLRLAV